MHALVKHSLQLTALANKKQSQEHIQWAGAHLTHLTKTGGIKESGFSRLSLLILDVFSIYIYICIYTHTHIYMSVSVEVCFGYVSMALEASEASCNNYISNAFWGYVPMPEAADTKRFAYAEARDLRPKTLEPEAKNARTHHLPNKKTLAQELAKCIPNLIPPISARIPKKRFSSPRTINLETAKIMQVKVYQVGSKFPWPVLTDKQAVLVAGEDLLSAFAFGPKREAA